MTYLSHDDILKADDRETRDVDVPEWGGIVKVRALSGYDRDAYQASMMQFRDGETVPELGNLTAKLVARAIVNPDTLEPMFTELEIGQLGQLSAIALARVQKVAAELSGITEAAVEEAEGNSDAAPSGDSTSD